MGAMTLTTDSDLFFPLPGRVPEGDSLATDLEESTPTPPILVQLPQYRAGNRSRNRVPSFFRSLFGWFRSQVLTGSMISVANEHDCPDLQVPDSRQIAMPLGDRDLVDGAVLHVLELGLGITPRQVALLDVLDKVQPTLK
jgi:hypothetical protein